MTRTFAALALLLASTAATADEQKTTEAQKHFQEAEKAYNVGDFARALKEYQASYDLFPSPLLLYDIAQSYRQLGENEKALFTYRRYVENAAPDDQFRSAAQDLIKQLEPLVEQERKSKKSPPTGTAKPGGAPAPEEAVATTPATVANPAPTETHAPSRRLWWALGVVGAIVVVGAVIAIVVAAVTPKDASIPSSTIGNGVINF